MDISSLGSTYNDYSSQMEENLKSDKLKESFGADYSNASDKELMEACKQFESYFLEQVFKEMYKTIPKDEEMSGSSSTMLDYVQDSMIQETAKTSTDQSSLGLAQVLYEQMKRNYE